MRTRNADSSSKSTTPKKTPPARKSAGESPAAKRTPPSKPKNAKKTEASPATDPDQSRKFLFFPLSFVSEILSMKIKYDVLIWFSEVIVVACMKLGINESSHAVKFMMNLLG
jgi:hypothetical protein